MSGKYSKRCGVWIVASECWESSSLFVASGGLHIENARVCIWPSLTICCHFLGMGVRVSITRLPFLSSSTIISPKHSPIPIINHHILKAFPHFCHHPFFLSISSKQSPVSVIIRLPSPYPQRTPPFPSSKHQSIEASIFTFIQHHDIDEENIDEENRTRHSHFSP